MPEGRLENELAHLGAFLLSGLEHVVDFLVLQALLRQGAYRVGVWRAILGLALGNTGKRGVQAVIPFIAEQMHDASLSCRAELFVIGELWQFFLLVLQCLVNRRFARAQPPIFNLDIRFQILGGLCVFPLLVVRELVGLSISGLLVGLSTVVAVEAVRRSLGAFLVIEVDEGSLGIIFDAGDELLDTI